MKGIYIHIPFCIRKCAYCTFSSIPRSQWDRSFVERYLCTLRSEIAARCSSAGCTGEAVDTLYFGGGTPSLLEPSDIEELIDTVREHYHLQDDAEITVEVNPGTVNAEKLNAFQGAGITRVSIGVQSFDDDVLATLGRIHRRRDIEQTLRHAEAAGFSSFSLDLIFALPGQSMREWEETLQSALQYTPPHISVYCLTPEEGSPLGDAILRGDVKMPSDEESLAMYQQLYSILRERGYRHYEISNFALEGHRCRHNWKYWSGEDYSGYGSSASSYENRWRFTNCRDPFEYAGMIEARGSAVLEAERLSLERQMGEYVMMALRTERGLSVAEFNHRFGVDFNAYYGRTVVPHLKDGYLQEVVDSESGEKFFSVPEHHLFVANEIAIAFL
ncbi:MAG: radical SAM family heme chaperone HemW [Candidatus Xenobiia bacterium LiM19]